MDGVQLPQGYSHFEEAVYFLPFSSQNFLVLILLTSEGWMAESTLEPPSGFEHGAPGLVIQRLNHQAIAPWTTISCVNQLMPSGNNRSYALNLKILPTGFCLSIYALFLPPDIKGLNIRRYLSLVILNWKFSKASHSAYFFYTVS